MTSDILEGRALDEAVARMMGWTEFNLRNSFDGQVHHAKLWKPTTPRPYEIDLVEHPDEIIARLNALVRASEGQS